MKTNYYFLASVLPDLQIGNPLDLSFHELENLLKTNLTAEDYQKIAVMRRYDDLRNMRAFWLGEELDPRGNFNAVELEELLITRMGFPDYVFAFLEKYTHIESCLRHFSALLAAYFDHEIQKASDFLKNYLIFEREWRLVVTGFRAKKLGRDIAVELQFENPYDEVVAQILAQKDAKNYEPPARYRNLRVLFEEHDEDPLALHKALCIYRFSKIEALYAIDLFSIDRILAYWAQFAIAERWLELDQQKGKTLIDTVVKEAS